MDSSVGIFKVIFRDKAISLGVYLTGYEKKDFLHLINETLAFYCNSFQGSKCLVNLFYNYRTIYTLWKLSIAITLYFK